MITNEIFIDLIDFIIPETISLNSLGELWQKYERVNKITLHTNIK